MPSPRVRFTIRGLMIAVAAVVGLLGVFRTSPMVLFAFLALNVPGALVCLAAALDRSPGPRVPWWAGIGAAAQGAAILGAGWLCAAMALSILLRQSGAGAVAEGRKASAEFWGLLVPMAVTAIGLAAFVARIVAACASRRRHDLLPIVLAYAWAIAVAWLLCFAVLGIETFD
jgi:hypothetical protein